MKKTVFSLLIIGSSLAVCAQDNNSMSSNSNYNAYSNVPINVRTSFQRDYPSANNVNWSQNSEWWHVSYVNNGQAMNTYYNMKGQTFNVALPVMETQVPADVVSRITTTYGPGVYDITRTKGENDQDVYLVRVLDNNGQIRTERINGEGVAVNESSTTTSTTTTTTTTDANSSNSSTTDMNSTTENSTSTTTDMNTGVKQKDKMKIKTITSDGKKEILKTKNGKMKTRTSNVNNQNY